MWRYVPSTMLFAASESAVTKKPRLRFTINRSSSVNPFGFFQRAMSRFMFTSCGIQWFAQPERYFSQAHLYLNGTSWLTSVFALMTRLSSARTRVWAGLGATTGAAGGRSCTGMGAGDMRPDGVGWIVCRPRTGAIGVSSSKLSMTCGLLLAFLSAPLFVGCVSPLPSPPPGGRETAPEESSFYLIVGRRDVRAAHEAR